MAQSTPEADSKSQDRPEDAMPPPSGPEGPSTTPPARRWFRPLPILVVVGLLIIVGGAIGAYFYVAGRVTHPPEETARFLPDRTRVYFSLNLRPGAGQLLKFRKILTRFEEGLGFEERLDDLLGDIEDETGIDLREDLFPWMGPELALGVVDFGDFQEEDAEVVAFMGTRDSEAAKDFLVIFLDYLEEEEGIEFGQGRFGGFTTYSYRDPDEPAGAHFVVTEEYVVFATTEKLLNSTIDMMDEPKNPLYDSSRFRQARDSVDDPRFTMLYVNLEGLLGDFRRQLEESEFEILETLEKNLPDVLALSASVIDMGIKVSATYDTPPDSIGVSEINALKSADHLPSDTLALISMVGVREAWEEAREKLDEPLEDFGLDFSDALREVEEEIGLDIDRDIFGWMAGEVAIALLPSEFRIGQYDEIEEAIIHAIAMIEFDDRGAVEDALVNIIDVLEETGVDFDNVRIRGEDAVLADLGDDQEFAGYAPGYMILENQVVVGTTRQSLEQVVSARDRSIQRLTQATEYQRLLKEVDGPPDFVFYANVKGIVEMIVDALGPSARATYQDEVAPFVEPIEAFFFGAEVDEARSTWTTILTFE